MLAIAIAEKKTADEAYRKLAAAGESLQSAVFDADRAAEAARQAVEDAKADTVSHLTAIATGNTGKPPKTVKAARAELAEAEEALELARAARDGLTGRIGEAKATAERMVDRVRDAAKAVLADSAVAKGLLDRVLEAQRELISQGRALSWLMNQGILPGDSAGPRQEGDPLRPAYLTKQFIDMLPVNYLVDAKIGRGEDNGRLYSDAPAWQAALEALTRDPAAPLPGADR
jgi:hypothetical protein